MLLFLKTKSITFFTQFFFRKFIQHILFNQIRLWSQTNEIKKCKEELSKSRFWWFKCYYYLLYVLPLSTFSMS